MSHDTHTLRNGAARMVFGGRLYGRRTEQDQKLLGQLYAAEKHVVLALPNKRNVHIIPQQKLDAMLAAAREEGNQEARLSEHKERLELWNEGVEEGRRRERGHIVKMIDGHKEVYGPGQERFYPEAKDGDEKDHIDSCCNETLDELLLALTTDYPANTQV